VNVKPVTSKNVEHKEMLVMLVAHNHTVHYVLMNVTHVQDLQLVVKNVTETESMHQNVNAQQDITILEFLLAHNAMENV